MDTTMIKAGDYVSVKGYSGVAFCVDGPELESRFEDDGYWGFDEEKVPTGNLECHMVGDDRTFAFDPSEMTKISDEDFCGGCGQLGCHW